MRRWWLAGGGGLGLLMLVTLLLGAAGGLGSVASAEPADDAGQLRELAERLLNYPGGGPGGQPETVELLPGKAPSDPALDFPGPEGSRLIGSAVHHSGDKTTRLDEVLDVPGSAQDVINFYQKVLPQHGWNTGPGSMNGRPGGFLPSTTLYTQSFCQQQGSSWLMLNVTPRSGAPNDVRLHLDSTGQGPCDTSGKLPPGVGSSDKLPALYAPEGVQVMPAGSSGGGSGPYARWTSSASAETDKSPADLEAAFAKQLEAAGWKRVAGASQSPLAWSTWTLPGDEGDQGFLYTLQATGKNRIDLFVQVESGSASSSASGGWYAQSASKAVSAN